VIGTPHLNVPDNETILTTKHKRGIFAELKAFQVELALKERS